MEDRQITIGSRRVRKFFGQLEERNHSLYNDNSTEWLWEPYIQYGKVTVVDGEMNAGKTALMVHIAAKATTGMLSQRAYSQRTEQREKAVNVFYLSSRENINDFVLPRFLRCGGDRGRICFNDETRSHMVLGEDSIKSVLEITGVRLMVVDPWQDFLEYDVDKDGGICTVSAKADIIGEDAKKNSPPKWRLTERQKADRLYVRLTALAKAANIAIVIVNRRDKGFHRLQYTPRLVLSHNERVPSLTDVRKYSGRGTDYLDTVQFRVDADRRVQFVPRKIEFISAESRIDMDAKIRR